MPTETSKVGPRADEQMSSCFLKLYTPTRVCEIIIMSCSSAQPLTLKTFVYCAACYAAKHRSLGRMLSDIHPISVQNKSIYITTSLPLRNVRELFINLLNPLQRVKRRSLTSGRKNVFLRTEEREHGERSIERRSRESF